MRSACWALLLLALLVPGRASAQAPGQASRPLLTRQIAFSIPFRLDGSVANSSSVEVQLHVSEDMGTTWRIFSRVQPRDARFRFQATHDGEYWFMVRTVDEQGIVRPPGPPAPELKVVVDATQPQLEFTATRGEAGEIRARWRVRDPNLRPDGLRLTYRGLAPTDKWHPVAVDPIRSDAPDRSSSGAATWWPENLQMPVMVQAEALDAAGNSVVVNVRVEPAPPAADGNVPERVGTPPASQPTTPETPAAPTAQAGPTAPLAPQAQSNVPPPSAVTPLPPQGESVAPPPGSPAAGEPLLPDMNRPGIAPSQGYQSGPTFPRSAQKKPRGGNWPGQTSPNILSAATPPGATPQMANSYPPSALQPSVQPPQAANVVAMPPLAKTRSASVEKPVESEALPPPQSASNATLPPTATAPPVAAGSPPGNAASPVAALPASPPATVALPPATALPPTDSTPVRHPAADLEAGQEAIIIDGQALPPGVRPQMVNRKRFELEYEVVSIGPEGVGQVELWCTRDGGRTWASLGRDDDHRSPFVVNVDGEGLYGFRMVIETSTGVRGAAPHPGELPEVWVGIDTTKPVLRLLPTDAAEAAKTGELTIRWEADDQGLAARPIALYYALEPNGPWNVLATGLENTGRYMWHVDPRIGDRVWLKVDARDEAGNLQSVRSSDPIEILRVRPQGRILNVRPIGDAARKSAKTIAR